MSELLKNLESLKKEQKELVSKIQKQSQIYFKEESQEIFKTFPQVKEFSWAQYTPWFNDGDECRFSVRDYTIKINGFDEDDDESKEIGKQAFNAVKKLVNYLDEDDMQSIFGDHVEITVKPDGITIEDYEHD